MAFSDIIVDWFITDTMHRMSMPSERARLAIVMTLMMMLSPISYAGVSNWSGPSIINSEGTPTVVDGFTVPTNSTIMDGWVHVTNSPLSSSSDSGITWDGDDFSSGNLVGVELNLSLIHI